MAPHAPSHGQLQGQTDGEAQPNGSGNDNGSGRVWFITGTSTGFGRALAEAALAHGDRVAATARDTDAITDLAQAHPDRAIALRLDVTDPESVRNAVDSTVDSFGRVDVVVNNAGYGQRGAIEEITDEETRRQFETNVFGVLEVTRATLPVLRAQRSGHYMQVSSVGGVRTTPGGTVYGATKFALEGLSEGLASEVAHLGIKVTILQPGPFRTDFSGRSIRWATPMADYATVIEPAREKFEAAHGTQPGDPSRAAEAIIAAADMAEPPSRLPLGGPAFDGIRDRLTSRLAELDTVEPLGRDTDFARD